MADTIVQILKDYSLKYKDSPIQYVKDNNGDFEPVTFKDFYDKTLILASAFMTLGVGQGSRVGVISENRGEWLLIDQALFALRAGNVPRGCDVTTAELSFILDFAECETVVLENVSQLEKFKTIQSKVPNIKNVILLDGDIQTIDGINSITFDQLLTLGKNSDKSVIESIIDGGERDDLATIIFTSGTTGEPKGVMLSQYNFVHQTNYIDDKIVVKPGDIWLSVLPVWHSYERALQYISLVGGSAIAYSKPIGRIMLKDFEAINPSFLGSVPRIWVALKTGIYKKINSGSKVSKFLFHFFTKVCIKHRKLTDSLLSLTPRYTHRNRFFEKLIAVIPWLLLLPVSSLGHILVLNKIKSKFGTKFVAGISGGGSLPPHVEEFFNGAGILLLEGYGLTESAPIVALKKQLKPVRNSIGPPLGCQFKILDGNGNILPPGNKGILHIKGDQVMLGYLKKDELTKTAIDNDGWLNSGDLAVESFDGEYKIVGREKDTIVLLGGENVEPEPIEQKLSESIYIETPVVIGQDQKSLSALIVVNMDSIKKFIKDNSLAYGTEESICVQPEIRELINDEISRLVSAGNGFKTFERIYKYKLLGSSFEVGKELSGKQDLKRHAINEIYATEIKELYN